MYQSNNTDYQDSLFNNQNGLEVIQNDPRFSGFRNNPSFMLTLNTMRACPRAARGFMECFRQIFPEQTLNCLMNSVKIVTGIYTQSNPQDISSEPSNIDKVQRTKNAADQNIKTQKDSLQGYQESRKKLIEEIYQSMIKIDPNSQKIEEIPSEAKDCLDKVKKLSDNINNNRNEYSNAKDDSRKIDLLQKIIELQGEKIRYLGQIIEIYKREEKDLHDINKSLKVEIDRKKIEQNGNMGNSNQVNINLANGIDNAAPSLLDKIATVTTKNKSENDIKPDVQHNNENFKQG